MEPDDSDRRPLDEAELARAALVPGGLWRGIRVLAETGSTNADLIAAAKEGEPEGLVLVAESQTAGRGRYQRRWETPTRAGLTFSMLLRPRPAPGTWAWLPLLVGLAAGRAVEAVAGPPVRLKWPNDLVVGQGKLAGILAERAGEALIVGVGLNVSTRQEELPVPAATSLRLAGATTTDRNALLGAVLTEVGAWYRRWSDDDGDADRCGLRAAYRTACATLGTPARVELPDGGTVEGTAEDVDADGRLVLRTAGAVLTIGAGDLIHLR